MKIYLFEGLLVWNLIVFATYAIDKWKAVHHRWRIPEKVLLLEALIAGGFGAVLAGQVVHHKTRKWYFWLTWLLGIMLDLLFIYFIAKL